MAVCCYENPSVELKTFEIFWASFPRKMPALHCMERMCHPLVLPVARILHGCLILLLTVWSMLDEILGLNVNLALIYGKKGLSLASSEIYKAILATTTKESRTDLTRIHI